MLKLLLNLIVMMLFSFQTQAAILACSDRIEGMKAKKEKEGLGELGASSCKGHEKGPKARYKPGSKWECKPLEDYPCVDKPKLKMVQCDREWECSK